MEKWWQSWAALRWYMVWRSGQKNSSVMTMKITDSEKEIDIKSKKVEWGNLFRYLSTTTMKDRKLETESQRIALMLAVLTVQNTTWKDKNNFSRSKRRKKKKELLRNIVFSRAWTVWNRWNSNRSNRMKNSSLWIQMCLQNSIGTMYSAQN